MSSINSGSYSPLVAYASELGCSLNSSLTGGGGSDDTARLQQFLNKASATSPIKLILDGVALTTGLTIAATGYTTIEGLGPQTGLFLANGSNKNVISAGKNPDNTVPAGRAAYNLALRRFAIAGNGGNQSAGFGVVVNSYSRVTFEGLVISGTYQYCTYLTNCNDVEVQRCSFTSSGNLQDGVHFNGPAERILINACTFATGDDGIALNCPEGYGGDITDVKVTNCVCNSAYRLMRCYTSAASGGGIWHARRILVSGCSGTTTQEALFLGLEQSTNNTVQGQIVDFVASDCTLNSPVAFAAVQCQLNFLALRGCTFIAAAAVPMVNLNNQVGTVEMTDCTILRNVDFNAAAYPVQHSVSVGRLIFAGVRIVQEPGASYSTVPQMLMSNGPLGVWWVDSIDPSYFGGISSNLGNISKLGGPGISQTGGAFASSQMLDNCVYQNSSAQVAMNISGTMHVLG